MNSKIHYFYIVVFILISILILREAYFFRFPGYPNRHDQEPWIYSENKILITELKPNITYVDEGFAVRLKPYEVRLNSEGFRDENHDIKKINSIKRIIVSGDSFAFGYGVDQEEMFTEILKNNLNEKYEIINIAVPGYNMIRKVEMIKERGLKYSPDLIIIQYLPDDKINDSLRAEISRNLWLEKMRIENRSYESYSVEERFEVFQKSYDQFYEEIENGSLDKIFQFVEKPLEQLSTILDEETDMALLLFPINKETDEFIKLKKLSERYDWYVLDLSYLYDGYGENSLILHQKDMHPNARAHQLVADEIEKFLGENFNNNSISLNGR